MRLKDLNKKFQRGLVRNGLKVCGWLIERLPYNVFYSISHVLLAVTFVFVIRHRRIAKESMDIAFGNSKTDAEKQQLIKTCFFSFGYGMFEVLYCLSHPRTIDAKVALTGLEHLEKALAKGKGVIAVTAHFGNFPLLMLYLAHRNYPTSCIIRATRDEELTRILHQKREQVGLKTIYAHPRYRCANDTIKALRNNEIVFIPIDQHFGAGGVLVDFFGQKASTATGPVTFARRTEAEILPMFIFRDDRERHQIVIEPPVKIVEKADDGETMVYNMSAITKLIESYVRKYPSEWAWMHRRWKATR